jgi:hypothetical protein
MEKKITVLIVFSFLITNVHGKMSTIYKWIHKEGAQAWVGNCFQLDSLTFGKNFRAKVDKKFCKPIDTIIWFNTKDGKCYERDINPGFVYAKSIDRKNCKPKETTFQFANFNDRKACYEFDTKTNGKQFFELKNDKKCDSDKTVYKFLLGKYRTGKCYHLNKNQAATQVKINFCKPKKTNYVFHRLSDFKGQCYELRVLGEKFYSKKVSIENCKPLNTIFIFYNDENPSKSKCYELDPETKGNEYLAKVKPDKCIN